MRRFLPLVVLLGKLQTYVIRVIDLEAGLLCLSIYFGAADFVRGYGVGGVRKLLLLAQMTLRVCAAAFVLFTLILRALRRSVTLRNAFISPFSTVFPLARLELPRLLLFVKSAVGSGRPRRRHTR